MTTGSEATERMRNGFDSSNFVLSDVIEALHVIHGQSTNHTRWKASEFLEGLKSSNENALHYGFILSTDGSQPAIVQHFGLSLLGHVIRHGLHELSEEQNNQLRNCVVDLGRSIKAEYLAFIRNKIAELWIELAKRSWALDWFDLDQQLVQLWGQELVHKDFVLTILENLSEDTFVREDNIAVLRSKDLNPALVEVFTPTSNYSGGIKIGGTVHHMRFGDEGWLTRITAFIQQAVNSSVIDGQSREAILKALATLRSAFLWVMTPAISQSDALEATCNFLTSTDPDFILPALEALLSLYGRIRLEDLEVQALVLPLIHPDSLTALEELYRWSVVSKDESDSPKYVVSKKLSELLSLFADHICHHADLATMSFDLAPFLNLLSTVGHHESLIVSIPVIHAWVKLLEVPSWRAQAVLWQCVTPIVNVVSSRLIQYDQLPKEIESPVVAFMDEEIELFPERQGFYLNYRRLCAAVIEWICCAFPNKAIPGILNRVDTALEKIGSAEQEGRNASYQRVSMVVLQADADFALADAALKGFDRFQDAVLRTDSSPEDITLLETIRKNMKLWLLNLMSKTQYKDPQIKQRQIKTAVEASYRVLQKDTGFAFSVLEHILSSFITNPQHDPVYAEAVEELHAFATGELRRLSLQHADYFVTFYDQLQSKFSDLINQIGTHERLQIDLKSILFSVIQRATSVDPDLRRAKLEEFLRPLAAAWTDENIQASLSNFEAFAASQAFDRVGPYMAHLQAGRVEDWSLVEYDNHGVQVQQDMSSGYSRLPLRETRILLSVSTERLEAGSELQKMICDLWTPMIPTMLDYVLRLISYNHQLHNPTSWPNAPVEVEGIIRRILRDRYWQSGISAGSMGEFHSKVRATKSTLEGFASSVRGRIRNNLEQCYSILHTLGRLGPTFYDLPQLPEVIARAAIDTAAPLSAHHFSMLIQMLPKLIDECPPESRRHFLTPIIRSLLVQMETKLSAEWDKVGQLKQTKHDDENLGDEMRDDSVLRQTTYKAVNLVAHWLNPKREQQLSTKKSIVNGTHLTDTHQQTMREFLLCNVETLEQLLKFLTRAMAFKDTKSGHNMITATQRLVPDFATDQFLTGDHAAAAREFISTETLKTAITCLNDGYFADQQQYYAQLIATIWISYGMSSHVPATENTPAHDRPALTATPRNVILSLEGMTESKVDEAAEKLLSEGSGSSRSKKLRAIILSLLESVRGVRISEMGKIGTKQQQSKLLEKYQYRENFGMQGVEENGQIQQANTAEVDLGGVADMFAT